MPVGKRPRPRVAKGKANKWNTSSGQYDGVRGNKSPTGSRPVPSVAANHPAYPMPGNATKPAIKKTKMPTPKMDQTTGASRATGGGKGY